MLKWPLFAAKPAFHGPKRLLRQLEDRILFSATPVATVDLPPEEMINESFQFTINFDNASANSADVGYVPYVDLWVPAGVNVNAASATYLGSPVDMQYVGVFNAGGNLVHPVSGAPVNHPLLGTSVSGGNPGESLYVVQLPFGSFVPDQPIAQILVNATLDSGAGAMVGNPLTLSAAGGFALGEDPLDNPGSDPPIIGVRQTDAITPTVLNLTKTFDAPEAERSTGPNFPINYTLTVDIANGETLTNLNVLDFLPNSFVYIPGTINITTASGVVVTGQNISQTPTAGAPQNAPNNDFVVQFASATGTLSDADIVITYTVYIDRLDANGIAVINAISGDDVDVINDSRAFGTHSSGLVTDDDAATDLLLTQKSLAIQKGVAIVNDTGAVGGTPGDTLEYTLTIQISDFFQFSSLIVDDNFSDGQRFDSSFAPTFVINENGSSHNGSFSGANYSVFLNSGAGLGDGSTDVHFDVFAVEPGGLLTGDLFADAIRQGGTTVTIRFRTIIQETFSDTFPSGDPSVDIGDILTNTVTTSGILPSGQGESDGSATSFDMAGPAISKTIYAIDGSTALAANNLIAGHTVTYRLRLSLPSADVESLRLIDYLPLPVFNALTMTSFNPAIAGSIPGAGVATYGPLHNLSAVLGFTVNPTMTTDGDANSVTFDFGSFDVDGSGPAEIDILFTIAAQDVAMADGLTLTNQVLATYGSTNSGTINNAAIIPIHIAAPDLFLTKGIVSTNSVLSSYSGAIGPVPFAAPNSGTAFAGGINSTNLAATPINANLTGADAGDLVKFAIVVENRGGADGFDLLIQDLIPAQYQIPGVGLNLQVRTGDGTLLTFTGAATDLFTTGIRINDASVSQGSINALIDAQTAGNGSNIIVITYDLQLTSAVEPNRAYINTASIGEFGAVDGGTDYTAGFSDPDWTDDASLTTRGFVTTKSIVATSEAHTGIVGGIQRVTIGEIVRYRLVIEIPEGTMTNLQLRDLLPPGLQFLNDGTSTVAFVSNGGGITSSDPAGTLNLAVGGGANASGNAPVTPTFALGNAYVGSSNSTSTDTDSYGDGTDPYFKLGTINNADRDADSEYIVLEFNALVLNAAAASNDQNDTRTNQFQVQVNGTTEATSNSVNVAIAEPSITNLTKVITPTTGDAGDVLGFTLTFSNTSSTTASDAFDVRLLDTLPPEMLLNLASINVTLGGGSVGVTNNSSGNILDLTIGQIPLGGTVTVTFNATLATNVQPGDVIGSTATLTYTSLPGANGTTVNPTGSSVPTATGTDTGERNGSGAHNDYLTTAAASITVPSPAISKSLIGTGIINANNGAGQAVVGETVQYSVTISIPEGLTNLAQIIDTLDAGLSFVSLDSITSSAGLSSSTVNLNNSATITPSVAGQVVTFNLGNVTNVNNSNGTPETITIVYTARVRNVVGNQSDAGAGTMLNNSAWFGWTENGTPRTTTTASAANVEVIEPNLDISKMVSSGTIDAGDSVTYTIQIGHNGLSDTDAFDVTFSDFIPTLINVNFGTGVTITHSSAGNIKALFELSAGNELRTIAGSSFDLLMGETVTISITGTISPSVVPGQQLNNTATANWTSIDGASANERTGADGAGGALDDYSESSSVAATVVAAPGIVKSLISTSINSASNANNQAVIGELVQYRVTITVPEATIPMSQIIDMLDRGLEFVSLDGIQVFSGGSPSGAVTSSVGSFGSTALFNPSITGDGNSTAQTLTFDFGTLTNSDSTNANAETIELTYTVRVVNMTGNQNDAGPGTMLNNSALFQWTVGATTISSSTASAANVQVIEPELQIVKNVSAGSGDAADNLTYTVTVSHTGNSDTDAFDVILNDMLPSQLNVNFATGVTVMHSTLGDITSLFEISGNTLRTIPGNTFDLLLGETLTVTVNGTVDVGVEPDEILTSQATTRWTSIDGTNAGERSGNDGVGGALDDYAANSSAVSTVIDSLGIAKTLVGTSINDANNSATQMTIGETAQYRIVITIPEGSMDAAQIIDNLGLGLQFISLDSIQAFSGAGATTDLTSTIGLFTNTALFNPTVTGNGSMIAQQLSFNLGDLVNNNINNGAAETLVLTYTARAVNAAVNTSNGAAPGTMINNVAHFGYFSNVAGAVVNTSTVSAANVEIIEPQLAISKAISDATPHLGQVVTYTLTINHTANSDADSHDIRITDLVPPGMTLNLASINVTGATVDANTSAGNNINLVLNRINLGGTVSITYTATVTNSTAAIGNALNNTANLTWTSLPDGNTAGTGNERDGDGGNAGQDDYAGADSRMATVTHPLVNLTKTLVGSPTPAASGINGNYQVIYDLTLTSTGNDPLEMLSLIEDLRAQYGGAFVGLVGSPTITASTASDIPELNGAYDGGITNNQLFNNGGGNTNLLAGGQSVTVRLVIEIDPDNITAILNAGNLVNQAMVSGTGVDTGLVASDMSDDPNNAANVDPNGDGNPDDPNLLRFSDITLTKQVVGSLNPAISGIDGNFDVTFRFTITNVGSTPLDMIALQENLSAHFGGAFIRIVPQSGAPAIITASTATDNPGINSAYDGTGANSNLFDSSSSLLNVRESITVQIIVEIDPDSPTATFDSVTGDGSGDFENQASVTGRDPLTLTVVSDLSDDPFDGTNDDPNGDNDPDDPTTLNRPNISLTKTQVGSVIPSSSGINGNFQVTYDLTIINTGGESLHSLSLIDDLRAQYGNAFVGFLATPIITSSTASDIPELNGAYDGGITNNQLFNNSGANTNLLAIGQTVTVRLVIEIDPNAIGATRTAGNFINQATTAGTGAVSGNIANDLSDDPNNLTNVDPNGDNNPDDPNSLRIPLISLEKQIVGTPAAASSGTQGNYDVRYQFTLTNTGSTALDTLTLIENIQSQFGGAFVRIVPQSGSPAMIVSSTATTTPTINSGYNGTAANSNIFGGSGNLLDVNQSIVVEIVVEVDPDNATATYDSRTGDGNFDLENQASTTGRDTGAGTIVSDTSDDPTDTTNVDGDPSNPGNMADDNNDPDDPTALNITSITLTKTLVGPIVPASSGTQGNYQVTYDLTFFNTGNDPLAQLSLLENLQAQYGGAFVSLVGSPSIVASTATDVPELNSAYDGGNTNDQLFDNLGGNTNLLHAGQMVTVRLVIEVNPNDPAANLIGGGLFNQAEVAGFGTNRGGFVNDFSDDPNNFANVDPNGDNNPDDPNEIRISAISLTKDIINSTSASSGTYNNFDITYRFVITNEGSTDLNSLMLSDDWAAQFGNAFIRIVPGSLMVNNISATTLPGANGGYTGAAGQDLLDGTGLLRSGQQFEVIVVVEIDPNAIGGVYVNGALQNQAVVTGRDSANPAVIVSDLSDDTSDATNNDPNGDNNPDDPTRFSVANIGLSKQVLQTVPSTTSPGMYTALYELRIRNLGTTDLDNLMLTDDLAARIGAAYVGMVGSPVIHSSTAMTDPNMNGAFDGNLSGGGQTQLFDGTSGMLRPGEEIVIRFQLIINADQLTGASNNQATVTGTSANGNNIGSLVNDLSDTGNNPEGTNPGRTGDTGGADDPTLLPGIAIVKQHGTPTATGPLNQHWIVPVTLIIENTGSTDLVNLNLMENMAAQFGGAFISVDMPMINGSGVTGGTAPGINAAWSGDTSQNMLDGTGMLRPGDSFTITFNVIVNPDASGTSSLLQNQATISGNDPNNPALLVLDYSDSGTDPHGTNPGESGDTGDSEDPTPLQLPEISLTKRLIDVQLKGAEFDMTFEFVIENTGSVDLNNLSLFDDLAAQYAPHTLVVSGSPMIVSSNADVDPNLNAGWSTDQMQDIFDGSSGFIRPGQTMTIRFTITLKPNFNALVNGKLILSNQAVVSGQGLDQFGLPLVDGTGTPLGRINDQSDSGFNPNSTNPGEPGDTGGFDDPTPAELTVFAFDSFQDYSKRPRWDRNVAPLEHEIPALPIDTLYTGISEPGTTLRLRIFDDSGNQVGERTVVADMAGNWLATFPGTVIYKQPYGMEVSQTPATQNRVADSGFNLRRYFHPAVHHSLYFSEPLTVQGVMRNMPHTIINTMHEANHNPLGFGWNSHPYEITSASTNASWQ